MPMARRWVVMGVSGCGKSTLGRALAQQLHCSFIEGDALHSPANVAKMHSGQALNDADRQPWLLRLRDEIKVATASGTSLVLSCSALKRSYRDLLREGDPALFFIHPHGPRERLLERMESRRQSEPQHFMPIALLDSQLRDLEALAPDEAGLLLDMADPIEVQVSQVLQALQTR